MIGATKSKMSGAAKARHARSREARQQAARRVARRRRSVAERQEQTRSFREKFKEFFASLADSFAPGRIAVASDRAYEIHEEGSWRRRHDLIVKGGKVVGKVAAA